MCLYGIASRATVWRTYGQAVLSCCWPCLRRRGLAFKLWSATIRDDREDEGRLFGAPSLPEKSQSMQAVEDICLFISVSGH